jgi:hypothetical protein
MWLLRFMPDELRKVDATMQPEMTRPDIQPQTTKEGEQNDDVAR